MFLNLFHGRKNPDQVMNDWGIEGQTFKLEYAQWTYGSLQRIQFDGQDEPLFLNEIMNGSDMIFYDGMYYGDFSITDELPNGVEVSKFNPEKTCKGEKKEEKTYFLFGCEETFDVYNEEGADGLIDNFDVCYNVFVWDRTSKPYDLLNEKGDSWSWVMIPEEEYNIL